MRSVFDKEGQFLASINSSYEAKAKARGEIGETDDGFLILTGTGYWNDLSAVEKRKIHLAKERAKR